VAKKVKTKSRSNIVKDLDRHFSIFIRNRLAKNNIVECFTCGSQDHWKNTDCGHFMSRKHYATRWDELNCQVQCKKCNIFRHGEQFQFGINLDKKYGEGTAEQLLNKSRGIVKLSNVDLTEMIEYYKNINKTLLKIGF